MDYTENEILYNLINKLEESLVSPTGFKIKGEDRWSRNNRRLSFDIVIYKGANPLCVIEVKRQFKSEVHISSAKHQVRSAMEVTNARFGVITDGEFFFLYDRNNVTVELCFIPNERIGWYE